MKSVHNVSLKGKTVLLRCDLNSDVVHGKVILGPRIKSAAKTISFCKRKGARVVILAHQGNKGKKDFISLKGHARLLSKITKTSFVSDVCGKKAIAAIQNVENGNALLLENVRFHSHEIKNPKKNNQLIKRLSSLCDIFVNDAFSVSHRDHTSMTGFPRVLPSFAGPLLHAEVQSLKKFRLKNALFILGGGKPSANEKLLGKSKNVLAAGYFGQMILISQERSLGYQNNYLKKEALLTEDWNTFLRKLKRKSGSVITPVDFALNIKGKRVEKTLEVFPQKYQIDDIGEGTIQLFEKEIAKAKAIYMKGPLGYSSNPVFAKGTVRILKAIAKSNAFSIVGGGHLSAAIEKYRIPKSGFSHVSLSGGALANFIAGKSLPGIKTLEKGGSKKKRQ